MKDLHSLLLGLVGVLVGACLLLLLRGRNPQPTPPVPQTVIVTNVIVATNPPPIVTNVVVTNPPAASTPPAATAKGGGAVEDGAKGSAGMAEAPVKEPPLEPSGAKPYQRVFLLSIGVNDYPGYGNLKASTNDAFGVAAVFRERFGFDDTTLLVETDATRERIVAELGRLRGTLGANPNSDFFFYFSGHGHTVLEQKSPTNRVRRGFLLPYDPEIKTNSPLPVFEQRAIEMLWLAEQVTGLPARHRMIVLDSCFSGLAFVKHEAIVAPPAEVYREIITQPTVQILTAGYDTEVAWEHPNRHNGLFTSAFLDQLQRPGVRSMEEVFLPLRSEVRDFCLTNQAGIKRMTPQHRYLQRQKGTFVFVPRDRLSAWAELKPSPELLADANSKGLYRPVDESELSTITNRQNTAQLRTDRQWQETVDRYEFRASMGDPYAAIALAHINQEGLGVDRDPERARMWAAESSDAISAGLFGIKDPTTAKLVDGILVSALQNEDTAGAAGLAILIAGLVSKGGGGPTVAPLRDVRSQLIAMLQRPAPKYGDILERLKVWEEKLDEFQREWKGTPAPAEVGELRGIMRQARAKAEASFRQSALKLVTESETVLQRLENQLPKKQNGTPRNP